MIIGQVSQYSYPGGDLFHQDFTGTETTDAPSVTEMIQYASNPVIDATTVSAAAYDYPKEPDVIKIGSTYYMICTIWSTYALPSVANRDIILLSSTDLVSWSYVQTVKTAAHAATLFEWNGTYHVLYSYEPGGTSTIGWASASDVESTWTDNGSIGITNARDPFVVIESGTVYLFVTSDTNHLIRYATTNTDFTGWDAGTTAISLPADVDVLEAAYIVKVGSTYYMHLSERPKYTSVQPGAHVVWYTASSITGAWTKQSYVFFYSAADTWRDRQHGHSSFIRSGDIEDNAGPLQVGDNYPCFNEGGDGTNWTIGLFYGKIVTTRPTLTNRSTYTTTGVDVVRREMWIQKQVNTGGDTPFVTVGYNLPSGTTLWDLYMKITVGYWKDSASGPGIGLGAWLNSSNWWIVRLIPTTGLYVGKLEGGSFAWVNQTSTTVNAQQEYILRVEKTASNQVKCYLNGSLINTNTATFFGSATFELGAHAFYASGSIASYDVFSA